MKNILFINGCYPKEIEDFFISNTKVMLQNAANVLSWRIIDGFDQNRAKITVLTAPFIGYYPNGFSKLFVKNLEWSHTVDTKDSLIGFINIKGLETIIKSIKIFRYTKQWYKDNPENRSILIYSHYAGFMRGLGKIKRKYPDIKATVIITELNELDKRDDLNGFFGFIKSIPRRLMIFTTYKNLKYVDNFILLAKNMNTYVNKRNKPYLVIEGITDTKLASSSNSNTEEKYEKQSNTEFRVVYTGTLHKRYGIINLLEAIELIEDSRITLYIGGDGDARSIVKEYSSNNERIHYLGYLTHKQSIQLQRSSDLLVNAMPNFGIHTDLSFPSKIMEYMMIGKPVICYKVGGIPDEYDKYLDYFKDDSPIEISNKIMKYFMMDMQTRQNIGNCNKLFITREKNPQTQVKKILDLMGIYQDTEE